jgi:hypothetical protein
MMLEILIMEGGGDGGRGILYSWFEPNFEIGRSS